MEIWKTVPESGEKYQVSNKGRVRRKLVMGGDYVYIKPEKNRVGQLVVKIRHNWGLKKPLISDLVTSVFSPLSN